MRRPTALLLLVFLSVAASLALGAAQNHAARRRVIFLSDMGNEPDEEQQMVHMLMYCNEFDLDAHVSVTGKYLRKTPHPEIFHALIDGYAKVVNNLKLHAAGWPTPEYLHGVTYPGQQNYGIADVGEGKSSPGSEAILNALLRDDPRPIWVVVNAGANTLAQALSDARAKYPPAELQRLVAQLRVFENGSQDNAGSWICSQFPDVHWIRSNYQTYCYGGPGIDGLADNRGRAGELGPNTWQPFAYSGLGQHQWALEHIKGNHGPLGALWPIRQFKNGGISFLEGGGAIPFLGLVNKGLFDIDQPSWGGWSGRFSPAKQLNYWSKHSDIKVDEEKVAPFYVYREESDTWTDPDTGSEYTNLFAPVWRWRRAFFNDFVCRMDWCLKPYNQANHNPVAAFNGDPGDTIVRLQAGPGADIVLDASASADPDGDDLVYSWWVYREAGTYPAPLTIPNAAQPKTSLTIPADAAARQIHVILEVKDRNKIASLYDYRRIVIDVD